MDKTIEALRSELSKVRTGKATTALLDGVKVDYYGNMTPINQVGNITVLDSHTLSITPWDKSMVMLLIKQFWKQIWDLIQLVMVQILKFQFLC